MAIYKSALDLVGKTPLLEVQNFEKENNPLYGVYEFKRGFGGNVIEYIGEFTLPITKFNKFYNFLRGIKRMIKK